MAFKSRRGAAARRELNTPTPLDHAQDDAGVVVRKDRQGRRPPPAREPAPKTDDDEERRPTVSAAFSSQLYSNGGLDQLRKEQDRITNTNSNFASMAIDSDAAAIAQSLIPNEDAITVAKRKRQQLRQAGSAPQYIPLQSSDQPVAVAGGLYGMSSGTSTLVREEDDDDVPDLLVPVPKAPLSTIIEDIDYDDADAIGSPVSGSTMTVSEAEIHMAIVTRLEECRSDNAMLSVEAARIAARLTSLNSEHDSLTDEIAVAESKYIGLQELYATVSALVECVSGKSQIVDQLWDEYRDVRQDRRRHMDDVLSLHWLDQDRPVPDLDRDERLAPPPIIGVGGNELAPEMAQPRRRERSRQRRSTKAQSESMWVEGWTTYGDSDVDRESFQLMLEIEGRARQVFADVVERFSSIDDVLKIFSDWRTFYRKEYDNAYCDLSLPRLLAPYFKLILICTDVAKPKGVSILIASAASVRAFSASVMDALTVALIAPFLTTALMVDFSPFSMRDMTRCRAFCAQIRDHFVSVEIATSLRMLMVAADDRRQGGRRLGSSRYWGRSLKLLFAMKTMEELLGPDSRFMINAVANELRSLANTDKRSKQLDSILEHRVCIQTGAFCE